MFELFSGTQEREVALLPFKNHTVYVALLSWMHITVLCD